MQIPLSRLIFILLIIAMGLVACNLPAAPEPPPTDLDPSIDYTAAAETIIAQLTEVAQTLTPTSPGGSPDEATPTATSPAVTDTAVPPTESPAPPTTTSTSPPSPTATLPASDPRSGLGDPAFFDTFTDGTSWPLYTDDNVSFTVKDSQLEMTAFNPNKYNGWMFTWPVINNFYLEMTTKTDKCSGLDQHGLMLRATKPPPEYIGYLYGISCDGQYSLRRWNGEKYVTLVDWTSSDQINAGSNQTNRIGILADGTRLVMYVNGKLLQEVDDDTHPSGRFGVFVGSANTPDFTARADEIAQWNIP